MYAGERSGNAMDVAGFVQHLACQEPRDPDTWADDLLTHAQALDQGRPADDISILVAAILPRTNDDSRHLSVRMPL
jgi:hypothetical protein